MTSLNTPDAVASGLTMACGAIFAMIEREPPLYPIGERLILALLGEARTQNLCGALVLRRLSARLDRYRLEFAEKPRPALRGPRLG